MTRKDYAFISVIIILIGSNVFSGSGNWRLRKENRELRKENKQSEQVNKRLTVTVDSLLLSVKQRDKKDSLLAIRDSLITAEIKANPITTTNASSNTIIRMPVDSFMQLFTGYIDRAERTVNH